MKYYLIAGEASGDLHASHLMQSLKAQDEEAEFRFFGGDLMAAVGGTLVKHYRELAYMGFVPVLLHLRTILRNMEMCKQDIEIFKGARGREQGAREYLCCRQISCPEGLLLYLAEDLGVERIPHQEHQARWGRAVFHIAV